MADGFAMERFKARLLAPPKPAPLTSEERAALLMRAVTMVEIKAVARTLGLTFNTAYRERARLYERRPMHEWPEIIRPGLAPRADT
jgi:hypothetical protein